jgi:PKD domain-containing protein
MGRTHTRLPDYSIGATVLVVAIALPFFVFTRAEHLHRIGLRQTADTPSRAVQAVMTTPDPATPAAPPPTAQANGPIPAPSARPAPTAKKVKAHPTNPPATPTSTPTAAPTPTPDAAPIARLVVTPTAGPVPLVVTADASASTDTDQTPIAEFAFNFGDGSPAIVQSGRTSTHTYKVPGTYTVSVAVIDTARLSMTVSGSVTVS